jgi:5-oxoprolinase (ATP-hydrolysing)
VGGIAPGSMPAMSRHIDEEGCRSDGMLIVRAGRFLAAEVLAWLAGTLPSPAGGRGAGGEGREVSTAPFVAARNPQQNLADLQAQVAACAQGKGQLLALEEEVGATAVPAYMGFVQDNAEAAVQRLLTRLQAGAFTEAMDDGSRIQVSVSVDVARSRARIDFAGTSPQQPGNLNAPASITHSAVLYVFRTLLDEDIPLNAGVLRPLDVYLPPGSLLNPAYPAAVVAGNVETSQAVVDALFGALGALAASQGTMNNLSFGDAARQYYETVCGGAGAGPGFAGASAVHTHMTNSRLTDPEVLELNLPLRVEGFGLRHGSGGQGQWPGGDGVIRRLRFLAPMHGNLIASRRIVPPHGMAGGDAGLRGRQWLQRSDGNIHTLSGITAFEVAPGDLLQLETPGGGGYGKRQER